MPKVNTAILVSYIIVKKNQFEKVKVETYINNNTACFCQGHLPKVVKQLFVKTTVLTYSNHLCHHGSRVFPPGGDKYTTAGMSAQEMTNN